MRQNLKKLVIIGMSLIFGIVGCGKESQTGVQEQSGAEAQEQQEAEPQGQGEGTREPTVLNVAYQYGLAYAPLIIAQNQRLIEKAYEDVTGKQVSVVWNQMSSGADINTGISSGGLDVGFMGVAPAITGVTKGVGYKIFTNLSGQEHGMMSNSENVTTFDDLIGSDSQIALVNIGSIQHIILSMALENAGYDPHALDSNIVAMKHPDGMAALEAGSVSCHLTSSPYIFKEQEDESLYEIKDVKEAWGVEDSFIVGVASEKLYKDNPELYQALCKGIEEAVNYINEDLEGAAKITCEFNGNSEEEEASYMRKGKYMTETKGVFTLAEFMARAGFIDKAPASYSELVYDNVSGD